MDNPNTSLETIISIFGDSITYGAADYKEGGWVIRLRHFLDTNSNESITVYNHGVCGDNSDSLLERFKPECVSRQPNVIILAIGINDSQYVNTKDTPRVSLQKYEDNLTKLMTQARGFTDKVVCIGITKVDESKTAPIPWDPTKYYDNENIAKYNASAEKMCQQTNVPFINLFDLLEPSDLEDGLHPNAQGHQKMFVRIKEALYRLYGKNL